MFNWFKKKKDKSYKCNHHFDKKVGLFYKDDLSQYRNCFDHVEAYIRFKCSKCGENKDILLSSEQFKPEMYYGKSDKEKYIAKLKSQGYMQKHEIALLDYVSE